MDDGPEIAATLRFVFDGGSSSQMYNRVDGSAFGGDPVLVNKDAYSFGAFAKWEPSLVDDVESVYDPGFFGVYEAAFTLGGLR